MSEFVVRTSKGRYPVIIGAEILAKSLDPNSTVLIDSALIAMLCDTYRSWIPFHASEEEKTLAGSERIISEMHNRGMKRGETLTAIGGGALQDVATLCSSIYMRGIEWEYVPTTAMAMLDSCIGGKSSINVNGVKNLVGNIYPPSRVIIDVALADTLSLSAKICGLSEAAKICFAGGDPFDEYIEVGLSPHDFGSKVDSSKSEALVTVTLKTKQWFIEVDEFDRKERILLNFGHTYAHALESATSFQLPHGVAVGVGMVAALAHPMAKHSERTEALKKYVLGMLQLIPDIMRNASDVDWNAFDRAVLSDKKGSRDVIRLVLPAEGETLALIDIPRSNSAVATIRESMAAAIAEASE